jgi:hypothetical protein
MWTIQSLCKNRKIIFKDKLLIFQEISFVMFQQILSEGARSAKEKEITTLILFNKIS